MTAEENISPTPGTALSLQPKHLLDLLKTAALSDAGLLFLDNGVNEAPNRLSYASLFEKAQQKGRLLRDSGLVRSGQVVLTYFDDHYQNVVWFWSVVAAGGVGAVLSPLSHEKTTSTGQLENIKDLFGDSPLITSSKLAPSFASHGLNVRTIEQIGKAKDNTQEKSSSDHDVPSTSNPEDITAILFTSGSTGQSKAVQYSHAALICSVQAKAAHLNSRGRTFLSWISFDHSANFCEIHLQSMYVCSDQVHTPTSELMVEPYQFFSILSAYKVGYTFTPNFFLAAATRSLKERMDKSPLDLDLSHLETIMCAGEANRTETLAACDAVMRQFGAPPHSIKAAYGLSETASACFYSLKSPQYDLKAENRFASAGKHLPGVMEMNIVQEHPEDSPGQGVLHLRGEVVFKGYYNNPSATAACMSEDGWFNTGDIARLDDSGYIHLLGRSKEILILHGNNYSSFELECALETSHIPGLTTSYTAAFSTWDESQQSEAVVVLFNPSEHAIGKKNLSDTLQAIHRVVFNFCSQKALHVIPLPKSLLPKSTIGKLSRSKLKTQYEAGAFTSYWFEETPLLTQSKATEETVASQWDNVTPLEREIATVYSSVVGVPAQSLLGKDALLSSGIDSIGFLKLKKGLERALDMDYDIPMATLVRCHSVSDLHNELIKSGTTSAEYDPIVPLVTKGSKPAIFLLHPGAGEFLCWFNLLEYLPDRPLYAIRCKGLHSGESTFDSLQDQLKTYYKAIRRTQPEGPYLLLGYCLGGLLAFELAKMFEQDGLQVAFCGGIDNPPDIRRSLGREKYRAVLSDFLPALTGMSPQEAQAFTQSTAHMEDPEFYEAIYSKFPPEVIRENGGLTVQRIKAYGRVEDWHRAIAVKYEASGTIKALDIFNADALPFFDVSRLGSWDAVMDQWCSLAESTRIHKVQGNHYTVLKKPDIEVLQEQINKALDARGV